jgi:hypothetical protein
MAFVQIAILLADCAVTVISGDGVGAQATSSLHCFMPAVERSPQYAAASKSITTLHGRPAQQI